MKKTIKQDSPKKKVAEQNKKVPTFDELLQENFSLDPHFDLTISWEKVEPVYQKVLQAVAKNLKHDGFRPGKVPAHVAEEMVDRQYLAQEVLREVAPPAYKEALAKEKLESFIEPELVIKSIKPKEAWVLTAYLPQKPVIKLPDYKKVLKQEKKSALEKITLDQTEAKKLADQEKKPFQALTAEQMQAQATDKALFALLGQVKPKISPIMVKRSAQKEFEQMAEQFKKSNLKMEDYLRQTGQSFESLSQQLSYNALQNLQIEFILDALLEAEKITVDQAELLAKVKELMPNVTDEAEQKRQLEEPSVKNYLELLAKRKKLADWLLKL